MTGPVQSVSDQAEAAKDELKALLADQAVLTTFLAEARGQAIEPGVEAYSGLLLVSGVRATGMSGQFGLEGSGHGTGMAPGERQMLIDEYLNPNTSEERRREINILLRPIPPA